MSNLSEKIDYKQKYLKYKAKYLQLKAQLGAGEPCDKLGSLSCLATTNCGIGNYGCYDKCNAIRGDQAKCEKQGCLFKIWRGKESGKITSTLCKRK